MGFVSKLLSFGSDKDSSATTSWLIRSTPSSPPMRRWTRRSSKSRRTCSASATPTARRSTTCCRRRSPSSARPPAACSGMRHFDVQLIGGMALHGGNIAEMSTGEGKTLVATLAGYLNALDRQGRPRRHRQRLPRPARRRVDGPPLPLPGHDRRRHPERHAARASGARPTADITYGTNYEFGFDYLRDNMVIQRSRPRAARPSLRHRRRGRLDPDRRGAHPADHLRRRHQSATCTGLRTRRQRPRAPARMATTCSGEKEPTATTSWTRRSAPIAATERGVERIEQRPRASTTSTPTTRRWSTTCSRRSRPSTCSSATCDYVVSDGEVMIVDEFTGRIMDGRRWSDGLHQAVEAKEGVQIKRGEPDAGHDHPAELLPPVREALRHDRHGAYRGRRVLRDLQAGRRRHPHQPPVIRKDRRRPGLPHRRRKFDAVADEVRERHAKRPAGPGRAPSRSRTPSAVRACSKARRSTHQVLNAKFHEREADIVAQAGRKGAVTIATNMAGRGTDIMLGGNRRGHLGRPS